MCCWWFRSSWMWCCVIRYFTMFWSTVMPLSSGSSSQRVHNIKYWKTRMLEILVLDMTWHCWISCSLYFKGTCHLLPQGIKVHDECIRGPEYPKDERDIFLYRGKPLPKENIIICQETWNFFSKRLAETKKTTRIMSQSPIKWYECNTSLKNFYLSAVINTNSQNSVWQC